MSTTNSPPGVTLDLPAAPPRATFGWPPGSIRALMTLLLVAIVCAHMLIPTQEAIPGYLIYLLLLIIGHYFAVRSQARTGGPHPLYLPRGSVRLLIFLGLVGTIGYKLATDPLHLETIFKASVETMKAYPELPLVLLCGFFLGVFFRVVVFRSHPPAWWQNFEAWLALIATVGLGIAAILHLVINPSLEKPIAWPGYERFLTAVIAFYFGDR